MLSLLLLCNRSWKNPNISNTASPLPPAAAAADRPGFCGLLLLLLMAAAAAAAAGSVPGTTASRTRT
jgi:hypothetical protein